MAEEEAGAEPTPKPSGNMLKFAVAGALIILVSATGGFLTYTFVLAPALEDEQPVKTENRGEEPIPASAVPFDFDEAQATVLPSDPDAAAPLLLYRVSMVCADDKTRMVIEQNQQWFVAMLADLHSDKTREEINSPGMRDSIRKQAMKEANSLLRRLQKDPDPEIRVIEVLYLKCTIIDL